MAAEKGNLLGNDLTMTGKLHSIPRTGEGGDVT